MPEPASERFLIYQPNHGFGVELFLLETAFEIARTLERTLVIPPMPDLETNNYREGLDGYFRLNSDWPWISTEQYIASHDNVIDLVFQILPRYRKEYRSPEIRRLHPVWLNNIERLTSFQRMGFQIGEVQRLELDRSMTLSEVGSIFDTDHPMIGLSYINGLVESIRALVEEAIRNPKRLLRHVPALSQDSFLKMARSFAGDEPYTALHWRRGYHLQEVAKILDDAELPTAQAMLRLVPDNSSQIIVASDCGLDEFNGMRGERNIRSFRHANPQVNAVVDLTLCIGADRFVGTRASTFSAYVAYSRDARCHLKDSTVLL
jgi:hypothetical protein